MIKKLLLPISLFASAHFLSAADINVNNDTSILDDVTQMTEEQMRCTAGEDITITTIYPISKQETKQVVIYNPSLFGVKIVNGDTGEILQEFYMPLNP